MNKYYVEFPYSCNTYGRVRGYVYADTEDAAELSAGDIDTVVDIEYVETDNDNTEHYDDNLELELRQENVPATEIPDYLRVTPTTIVEQIPEYFLNELNLI